MQTTGGTRVLREHWPSAVRGYKRAASSLACRINTSVPREHSSITRSIACTSSQHLALRHRSHGPTSSPPSSGCAPRPLQGSPSCNAPLGGPRRSLSGPGASGGTDELLIERFVVTGSLLEARRAGADSPLPGQFLSISHIFGPDAVAAFATHAGDDNPIHLDQEYARNAG